MQNVEFSPYPSAANNTSARYCCVISISSKIIHCPPTIFNLQGTEQVTKAHLFNQLLLIKDEIIKHFTPEPSLDNKLTLIEIHTLSCFSNSRYALV